MQSLRAHLDALEAADDLVRVEERVHWDGEVARVGLTALEDNRSAVVYEETGEGVRLTSGVYAGPDQLHAPTHDAWTRLARALSIEELTYESLLASVTRPGGDVPEGSGRQEHEVLTTNLHDLGLPTRVEGGGRPRIDLAILCIADGAGETKWVPACGHVADNRHLRLVIPADGWDDAALGADRPLAVVLGAPPPVFIAALVRWVHGASRASVASLANGFADIPAVPSPAGPIPNAVEVTIFGSITDQQTDSGAGRSRWTLTTDTVSLEFRCERVESRPDPIVPFVPRSTAGTVPMADDTFATAITEAATLYRRVNNYWGVAPVEWIQLPVEANLGLCIVSSEILYAGFQWQLANTLFSFSDLFDKVLLLDTDADPTNLARGIDDMWVRAHPAQDWVFSESAAPRANAPAYRDRSGTGSRLYVDAAWDPNWDAAYIAPRVTFENSYSESVREKAERIWERASQMKRADR